MLGEKSMKKLILLLAVCLFVIPLAACQKEVPDYTIEEAFDKMNEAIQNYLDSESISLEYSGSYEASNYQINQFMRVKMKNVGEDNFIGQAQVYITDNGTDVNTFVDYESGWVYTKRVTDDKTSYVKEELDQEDYISLYKSFIKTTIDFSSTREHSIFIDEDQVAIHFELASGKVTSIFYVYTVLKTVNFATVDITFDHKGNLKTMSVEYNGTIDSITGVAKYDISVLKIDQYVIINQLSSSEKALYQEETE